MRSFLVRSMRFNLAVALVLGGASAISSAQNSTAMHHKARAGKGTPANLSHHRDNSDLVLHGNSQKNSGTSAELNKIEQQNLHSSSTSGAHPVARVKAAPLPKTSAAKADRNPTINFSGHSTGGNHTATTTNKKSGGRSPKGTGGRLH